MRCPYCEGEHTRVIDTSHNTRGIRRRRVCKECGRRFSTVERAILTTPLVVKRDGRRENFDRQKLFEGIWKACAKRPVSSDDVERLVEDIENQLYSLGQAEVHSASIGEIVMGRLKALDDVAYVRFASVYRSFADLETLKREVDTLLDRDSQEKG